MIKVGKASAFPKTLVLISVSVNLRRFPEAYFSHTRFCRRLPPAPPSEISIEMFLSSSKSPNEYVYPLSGRYHPYVMFLPVRVSKNAIWEEIFQ